MKWKVKAFIQSIVARLPAGSRHASYYALQRVTGSFRRAHVDPFFEAALTIARLIESQGGRVEGATFLEVGTGRRLTLPVLLWLMGAERVITVDLHRYLKKPIVELDLRALTTDAENRYASALRPDRVEALRRLVAGPWDLRRLMSVCSIVYQAPADAARLDLPAASIDYHVSYTVFEHIPAEDLRDILVEAGRVLRPSGRTIHLIDHSDHFSHTDGSISAINFLQYTEEEWKRWADNPYMYMNRLREDDYPTLYAWANHDICLIESTREPALVGQISSDSFQLASKFRNKSIESLTTTISWIVSSPRLTSSRST
jgi:SAM-dependent methyltransferase